MPFKSMQIISIDGWKFLAIFLNDNDKKNNKYLKVQNRTQVKRTVHPQFVPNL